MYLLIYFFIWVTQSALNKNKLRKLNNPEKKSSWWCSYSHLPHKWAYQPEMRKMKICPKLEGDFFLSLDVKFKY